MSQQTPSLKAWIIFSITAAFYAYEFFLRVAPAALQSDIMQHYSITAQSFGILMSSYYWTYTPLQLFVGSFMDLYGPRKTLIIAICSCLIGAGAFTTVTYFPAAIVSYAVVGFGSAFAFVGVLKLSASWFPKNYLAIASGIATSMGMIGAISGEFILDLTLTQFGYKPSFIAYFIIGILILLAVIFIVKDQPTKKNLKKRAPIKVKTLIRDFSQLTRSSQFWLNAIVGSLLFMPTNIFASMWAVMFFKQTYYMQSHDANLTSSLLFGGWAFGAPISGYLASRGVSIVFLLRFGSLFAGLLLTTIIFHEISSYMAILVAMFGVGLFSSVQILVFPNAVSFIDRKYAGTAVSLTNMVIMLNTFLSPLVGLILDHSWDGTRIHGEPIFSAYGFEQALLMLPISLFICFIFTYFMKSNA